MLSWAQIEKIYKSGVVDIASHSMTHCALTQISDKQLLYNEILTSKKIIEEKLATEIKIFTPPGSFYNRSIEDLVFKNGYEFLLNVDDCCWNTSRKIVSRILMPYTSFYKNLLVSNQLIQKIKKLRHLFFS